MMNALYGFVSLLIAGEMLKSHLLFINGHSTADEKNLQISAMKNAEYDIREMKILMNQTNSNTLQSELQLQQDETNALRQHFARMHQKIDQQLARTTNALLEPGAQKDTTEVLSRPRRHSAGKCKVRTLS